LGEFLVDKMMRWGEQKWIAKEHTAEWRETFNLDLFRDDESAATLLAGWFTYDRNCVLWTSPETIQSCISWRRRI
jgi:hypothetical protein